MIRTFLIILCCHCVAIAQVKVTGSFDRDTVSIGNSVTFTLSIETSNNEQILAIPKVFLDSIYSALQTFKANPNDSANIRPPIIADYELLDLGLWKNVDGDALFAGEELSWTQNSIGSKILYENDFELKFWDPGINIVAVPPILVLIDDELEQIYDGEQVSIFIAPPLGVNEISQDSLDIEPIKPILTEAKNISDYLLYIYFLATLLIIGIAYWLIKKWNNRDDQPESELEEIKIIVPAHKKALDALYDLRQEQLWQKGEIKTYQSKLTFIIRQYLEDRYTVPALESTTDEIIRNLNSAELELTDIDALKRILQVADLVKFAKAKPDDSIHDSFMSEAEGFVQRTKSMEQNLSDDE